MQTDASSRQLDAVVAFHLCAVKIGKCFDVARTGDGAIDGCAPLAREALESYINASSTAAGSTPATR